MFAIELVSYLSVQYALPKSLGIARLAVNVMTTLVKGMCHCFAVLNSPDSFFLYMASSPVGFISSTAKWRSTWFLPGYHSRHGQNCTCFSTSLWWCNCSASTSGPSVSGTSCHLLRGMSRSVYFLALTLYSFIAIKLFRELFIDSSLLVFIKTNSRIIIIHGQYIKIFHIIIAFSLLSFKSHCFVDANSSASFIYCTLYLCFRFLWKLPRQFASWGSWRSPCDEEDVAAARRSHQWSFQVFWTVQCGA